MLKVLGALVVIGATTIMGFLYSRAFEVRVKQLRDMQYALNMLESEIIYTATPLIQALRHVSEKSSDSIRSIFDRIAVLLKDKRVEGVHEAFNEAVKESKRELYFEKEEIDVIASFMHSLGSSDIEGQKKNFNITIKKLETFEEKAEETRVKNEKLYRYLGVCAGVLIVIILV